MRGNTTRLSATVSTSAYQRLEKIRKELDQSRSKLIDEAIKTWLQLRDERLMREGCLKEAEENEAMAKSAKIMASRVPLD